MLNFCFFILDLKIKIKMSDSSSDSDSEKIIDSKLPVPSIEQDNAKGGEPEEEDVTFAKLVFFFKIMIKYI